MKTCENYKAIQNQSCNPRPQTKGESSTLCIHRYLTGAVEVNHSKHTASDWLVPVKWAHENLEIRGDDVFFPQPLLQLQQHREAFQGLTAASAQKKSTGPTNRHLNRMAAACPNITRIQSWHCHGLLSTKIISCVMMCPVLVMPYVNALIDQLFEPWFHIETDHGSSCTIGRVCVELIGWKALASQSLEEVSASSSQGDHLFWVPIDERKSRQKNDFFAEKKRRFPTFTKCQRNMVWKKCFFGRQNRRLVGQKRRFKCDKNAIVGKLLAAKNKWILDTIAVFSCFFL